MSEKKTYEVTDEYAPEMMGIYEARSREDAAGQFIHEHEHEYQDAFGTMELCVDVFVQEVGAEDVYRITCQRSLHDSYTEVGKFDPQEES